jgi:very-short-patch-repair endonuclease
MPEEYNDNLHKGAIGKLYQYGRELRQSATKAEKILWEYLRNRNLDGLKFRRQHPVDKFMVVELDGAVHDDKMNAQYDEARSYELKGSGIRVMRFRNSEVENNISFVLTEIRKVTEK